MGQELYNCISSERSSNGKAPATARSAFSISTARSVGTLRSVGRGSTRDSLINSVLDKLSKANEMGGTSSTSFLTRIGIDRTWSVPDAMRPEVWKKICEYCYDSSEVEGADEEFRVIDDVQHMNEPLAIFETVGPSIPLIFNFNMKFAGVPDIPNLFIYKVCKALTDTVREAYRDIDVDQLSIAVIGASDLLKISDSIYEYHFRLQMPYFRVHKQSLLPLKRDFINKLQLNNSLGCIELIPTNKWEEIVDYPTMIHPVYKADEGGFRQRLITILTVGDDENDVSFFDVRSVFLPHNFPGLEPDGVFGNNWCVNMPILFFIPLFLSLDYSHDIQPFVYREKQRLTSLSSSMSLNEERMSPHETSPSASSSRASANNSSSSELDEEQMTSPKNIVQNLVYLIKRENMKKDWVWIVVGRAISYSFKRSDEGLKLWETVSPSEFRHKCKPIYNKLYRDGYTHQSIAYLARYDSPREYKEWHNKIVKFFAMKTCKMMNKHNIAKCFYWMYWLDFKCASIKNDIWVQFKPEENRYIAIEGANTILNTMSEDFAGFFDKMAAEAQSSVLSSNSTGDKNEGRANAQALNNLIFKLGEPSFKSGILKELTNVGFHDPLFAEFADARLNLYCFHNGVLDVNLDNKSRAFRMAIPEDYLFKKASKVEYPHHFTWDSPEVKMTWKWLYEIIRDRDYAPYLHDGRTAYEHCKNIAKNITARTAPLDSMPTLLVFILYLSSVLFRINREKWIVFVFGGGNNGKSMLLILLEMILGTGYFTYPEWLVVGNGKATSKGGGPNPEMAQAKDGALGVASEPSENSTFSDSFIKIITGMESFFARNNHQDGGSIKGTSKTMIMGNKRPTMPSCHPSLKRRFVLFHFNSLWAGPDDPECPEVPETYEEQYKQGVFPLDPFFVDRLADMQEALLWIMVEYLSIYLQGVMQKSRWMKDLIAEYWSANDKYKIFVQHCIETSEKAMGMKENMYNLHEIYKRWWRRAFPGTDPHNIVSFTEEFSKALGGVPPDADGNWSNITVREV